MFDQPIAALMATETGRRAYTAPRRRRSHATR
jgi:hypothetical protein